MKIERLKEGLDFRARGNDKYRNVTRLLLIMSVLNMLIIAGCGRDDKVDENAAVPSGDPPFTKITDSWVIDNVGVMDKAEIVRCSAICQKMQDAGVAEMVLLIQNGVKHPADYATHYGRWLGLGKKGLSGEGGNNGIVWLIRPDAEEKMTYSIGRGLPNLTSSHMVDIMNKAKEYFNFNNYDHGVGIIVEETSKTVFELYGKRGTK
jgi:hypothetical protein